jgi:hypothetical protein
MYREYETLFLPCIARMAGQDLVSPEGIRRRGIVPDATFDGDPEAPRNAKGVITSLMPAGRAYKPTVDQLPLTQLLDFDDLRRARLPCFGTLERALGFLARGAPAGAVYPSP